MKFSEMGLQEAAILRASQPVRVAKTGVAEPYNAAPMM
jgi:hypothetical protein